MVPTGMTSHVHAFDAREGGSFRISLTYDAPTGTGKTSAHTDTYHGRFVKLVTNEQVVEVVEFETTHPALQGEMTITITLADVDGGTDILAVHDGLPPGIPTADTPRPPKRRLSSTSRRFDRHQLVSILPTRITITAAVVLLMNRQSDKHACLLRTVRGGDGIPLSTIHSRFQHTMRSQFRRSDRRGATFIDVDFPLTPQFIPSQRPQPSSLHSNPETASNSGDVCRQVSPAHGITRWPLWSVRRQCVGKE